MTTQPLGWAILLLPALTACGFDPADASKEEDSSDPYVVRDTDRVEDSSADDTAESGDSPPDDTVDTEDTGLPADGVLSLYPDALVVFAGASFPLRAVLDDGAGAIGDLAAPSLAFEVSDAEIATVDASGQVLALSEGEVTITARHEGLEASISLRVSSSGVARVLLVDADSGEPIGNGSVSIGDGARCSTDAWGVVEAATSEAGPLDLNAWARGYIPVTFLGLVGRELVVPLRSTSSLEAEGVRVTGDVDLSRVRPAAYDELLVGFAAPSFQSDPIFFEIDSLLGANRAVSFHGLTLSLPANTYIGGSVEDYEAHTTAGAFGMWTLAGPVPIVDLTSGFAGTGDLVDLLVSNLESFSYDWEGGLAGADGESLERDLVPSGSFAESVLVSIPDLPAGFTGGERSTLFVFDGATDGSWAVVGLGAGDTTTSVDRAISGVVPGAIETRVLSVAQVDGLGSGGPMAMSAAPVLAGCAVLPGYLPPPAVNYFFGATHDYDLNASPDAHLVHVLIRSAGGDLRELYMPGGPRAGTLPAPSFSFSYGRTTWEIFEMRTTTETFEGFVRQGAFLEESLRGRVQALSRAEDAFSG